METGNIISLLALGYSIFSKVNTDSSIKQQQAEIQEASDAAQYAQDIAAQNAYILNAGSASDLSFSFVVRLGGCADSLWGQTCMLYVFNSSKTMTYNIYDIALNYVIGSVPCQKFIPANRTSHVILPETSVRIELGSYRDFAAYNKEQREVIRNFMTESFGQKYTKCAGQYIKNNIVSDSFSFKIQGRNGKQAGDNEINIISPNVIKGQLKYVGGTFSPAKAGSNFLKWE